ncbi:MAG TPA: S9 family peptidase [Ktedonobacterales bacterium]|nr:S9 family peptidase [Ktedonobacterales bacterium]
MTTETGHLIPRREAITPDTYFALRVPSDPRLSPDGTTAAYVVNEYLPGEQKPRGRIWLVETREGAQPRELATGALSDDCPRWSPDGATLAFCSRREDGDAGKPQLYVVPAAGGAPHRICAVPNGVAEIEWSPDGARIAFLSVDGEASKTEPRVNEPDLHQRLWTVSRDGDTPQTVTPANVTIWRYAWSPDSRSFAVYFSTGPNETDWYRGQLGMLPASGGAIRQIAELSRQAAALAWSHDGRRLAYVLGEWSDRPLVGGDIYEVAIDGGDPRNVTPDIECSPSWVAWSPDDGALLYAAWDGLTSQIGLVDGATLERRVLSRDFLVGDRAWPRLSPTADLRRFVTLHADQQSPDDVWLGERTGDGETSVAWRRLTRLNPLIEETLAVSPTRRIEYEGADGWRIEALYTPPLHPPTDGRLPPLILNVHGGPTSAYRDGFGDNWTQLLAAAGFAVLRPNIRGSIGRGVAFADAVLGDMGGKDFADALAGVDYVAAHGLADGARVGILGWSYGGFMVAWAVSQTTRFKAAVMGAGICDFHSFHAQTNIPDWDSRFLAADPNVNPQAYRDRSAITYAARITTPTLIVHGEQDECVPVNQAYAFYRSLRERDTPVELAVYPREGHGFRERDHLRDFYVRMAGWFTRYV